jgi:hypothetical protein
MDSLSPESRRGVTKDHKGCEVVVWCNVMKLKPMERMRMCAGANLVV